MHTSDLPLSSFKTQESGTAAAKVLEEDKWQQSQSPTGPEDNNSL